MIWRMGRLSMEGVGGESETKGERGEDILRGFVLEQLLMVHTQKEVGGSTSLGVGVGQEGSLPLPAAWIYDE